MGTRGTQCTKMVIEVKLEETAFPTLEENDYIHYEKFTLWNNMQIILKI